MGTRAVSTLDFREHTGDIARRKFVLCRRTNYFEFLAGAGARFMPACQFQGLANSLSDGHAARAGCPLNFPVFRGF